MGDQERSYLPQDERRTQLLARGLELFSVRSYEDVSIDDIARAAGISRGLMYHYFGSKRSFYTEVVRAAGEELLESTTPDPSLDHATNLIRGLYRYFEFVNAHETSWLALMGGGLGGDEEIASIIEGARAAIALRVLEAIDTTPSSPALRSAIYTWIGGVEACVQDWLTHRDLSPEDLIPQLVRTLVVLTADKVSEDILRQFSSFAR